MTPTPQSSQTTHLLWVLPKWPLPTQDGARVANMALLRGLTQLGVKIDLIVVAGEDENCNIEELKKICAIQNCWLIRRPATGARFRLRGILALAQSLILRPWLAVTLGPFASSTVRGAFQKILENPEKPWTALVYDGLHTAAHASSFGIFQTALSLPKVIYRAHNIESDIWKRKSDLVRFFPLRLFFRFQTFLMRRFENSLVRHAHRTLTVSDTDFDGFQKSTPQIQGGTVPIGYDFQSPLPLSKGSEKLLFLGRLDWPPNRDGLIWFLDHVWPEAKRDRPNLMLCIAGSGDSEWLKSRLDASGIQFLGRVASVEEAYQDSVLSLVPIFYGSGTRVKAIEASRYGRACLSTQMGVEGLGLENGKTYYQAETAADWIQTLKNLDLNQAQSIGQNAHQLLKTSFHLPVAAARFMELLSP